VPYQGSTKTENRRDAEGIASKARLDAIEGKYDIKRRKKTPLFKDAMTRFLEHVRGRNAVNTVTQYAQSSKPLIKAFGAKQLGEISPDDVEKYQKARSKSGNHGRPLKPASVNAELGCMRAMFSYFVSLDVVSSNPVSRVKFLPTKNEQTRVLSFEEERLYLAACPQPLHDIAVLMLETGMRPDEIYRMKREIVHLEAGYVFNPYGKTKAARRKLTLTKRAADLLKGRLETIKGEYVFPLDGDPDAPMGDVVYEYSRALKASKIACCRLYDCRHTFATRAVEAGVDLVTLAAILGHTKITMVLRYARPTAAHQETAIRKIEEFVIQKQLEQARVSELVQ
jgi:integrase